MLKLMGSCLVFVACLGYGQNLIFQKKTRIQMLEAWIVLLGQMMDEVRYERLPIPEILKMLSEKKKDSSEAEHNLSQFLQNIAISIETYDFGHMEQVWGNLIDESGQGWKLSQEEIGILKQLGNELGKLDIDAQLRQLQLCQKRLESCLNTARIQFQTKQKVYRTLSIAIGVMVILILL